MPIADAVEFVNSSAPCPAASCGAFVLQAGNELEGVVVVPAVMQACPKFCHALGVVAVPVKLSLNGKVTAASGSRSPFFDAIVFETFDESDAPAPAATAPAPCAANATASRRLRTLRVAFGTPNIRIILCL
jgi:hypothetical protein